jgi:DMSO reductase anchor subunit
MDLRFMEIRQKGVLNEWAIIVNETVKRLAVAAGAILIPVVLINLFYIHSLRTGSTLMQTSYDLLVQLYEPLLIIRFLLLLAGVGWLVIPVAMLKRTGKSVQEIFTPVYLACLLVIVGEILGRFLFYAAHIRTGL